MDPTVDMIDAIHIEILREDERSVWIKIRAMPGERPVIERSLNIMPLIEYRNTVAALHEEINTICCQWYDSYRNLELYCEEAKKWEERIDHHGEEIFIQLVNINAKEAIWSYMRKLRIRTTRLHFTTSYPCLDWVCAKGLTEYATVIIIQDVRASIDRQIKEEAEASSPEKVVKRKLAEEFLQSLPQHHDFAREAAALVYFPRLNPQKSLIDEIGAS
jgi:hypothetical protein